MKGNDGMFITPLFLLENFRLLSKTFIIPFETNLNSFFLLSLFLSVGARAETVIDYSKSILKPGNPIPLFLPKEEKSSIRLL